MCGLKKVITSPPKLAVIVAACLMIYALFIAPIGMADNGDFFRVMNGNGLYKLDRSQPGEYMQYFSTKYGTYEYYNEYQESLFSSQTLFISAATVLDRLFTGNDGLFDIRFLSVIISIWFMLGLYLLVDYATWEISKRRRYYIAALGVLFFADTGYTAYFNSFYAESIVFVSFITAISSALLVFQKRYHPYPLIAIYIISSLVLTTAKQQNAPLGVLLGILIIPVMVSAFKQKPVVDPRKARLRRFVIVGCSLLLCVCGIVVYMIIPQEFVDINKYHSMTRGILMTSQNPETALEFFNINPQYSLLDGTIYYERYPEADVEGKELKTEFYPQYGFVSVAAYYALHPREFFEMLNTAAKNAYVTCPEGIGNYQRSADKAPGAKTYFFTLVSTFKKNTIPRTVGFMIIWIAGVLVFSFADRKRTLVLAFATLMGLSQIVVSIIGAGDADLSKHIFLYNLVFDLANFLVISTVILRWRAKKETASEPLEVLEEAADKLHEPTEELKPDMETEQ